MTTAIMTRRSVIAAAPALALLPASSAQPMPIPSLKEQVAFHTAAIVALLRESAPAGFLNLGTVWLLENGGDYSLGAVAFAGRDFQHGDQVAKFSADGQWVVK